MSIDWIVIVMQYTNVGVERERQIAIMYEWQYWTVI